MFEKRDTAMQSPFRGLSQISREELPLNETQTTVITGTTEKRRLTTRLSASFSEEPQTAQTVLELKAVLPLLIQ